MYIYNIYILLWRSFYIEHKDLAQTCSLLWSIKLFGCDFT